MTDEEEKKNATITCDKGRNKDRPILCPCRGTCTPIYNGLAFDSRIKTGDLNEGYSGDCIGKSISLEYVVGGEIHLNDMNQCVFSPLKGIIRFQICKGDVEAMLQMAQSVLADIAPRPCKVCGIDARRRTCTVLWDGSLICCHCAGKFK